MVFWYLLILVVSLVGVRFCKEGFFQDYLGKEQCNAVKGIFIMLVFLGHSMLAVKDCGYPFVKEADVVGYKFWKEMGQLVVAMFLFYSGYGVMASLIAKGKDYLKTYPKNRLLTTLVNFDVAVCCFALLSWGMGEKPSLIHFLLSLTGWESLGNSSWYIFVILFCYLVFFLVYKFSRSSYLLCAVWVLGLVFLGMLILYAFKPHYWYDTMLVFPAGILYALCRGQVEVIVQKWYIPSLLLLLATFILLGRLHGVHPMHGVTYNLKAIVLALMIVLVTMKVKVGNSWLYWCGFSLFPLFIYQRLPMIAMTGVFRNAWVDAHPHLYIGICFSVTVGIALLYNKYLRIKLS